MEFISDNVDQDIKIIDFLFAKMDIKFGTAEWDIGRITNGTNFYALCNKIMNFIYYFIMNIFWNKEDKIM